MINELFYINNTQVNPPSNWQLLEPELNYGKDEFPQGNTISIGNFEWVIEEYATLMNIIEEGKTGGTGIFEGPVLRVDLNYDGITVTIFQGYIDLTKELEIIDKVKITTSATSLATVDWIEQTADACMFQYLYEAGLITNDMFHFVPYVNSQVPDYIQSATSALMVFAIIQNISKEIEDLEKTISDLANPLTLPNAIAQLIIEIAYLLILILTLISLIEQMIKFIISPVKYHAGMYVRDLCSVACQYLNCTFVSDIFAPDSPYYNEFIIPNKSYIPVNGFDESILGFLAPNPNEQVGYYKGTFGDLLRGLKIKCNAKIIVTTNSEVILIRRDKNAQPPAYQLPPMNLVPGYTATKYTYNTGEAIANTVIKYQIDESDMNTEQYYLGNEFQVTCTPKVVVNQQNVRLVQYNPVNIPFSRAIRKTSLTNPEKIFLEFFDVFDVVANDIIGIVNAAINGINAVIKITKRIFGFFGIKLKVPTIPTLQPVSLSQSISNRIGMMLLSADSFNSPKILILKSGSQEQYNKIDPSNDTVECAQAMWNNFYYVNSFVPAQLNPAYADRPTGNQYRIQSFEKVPFGWQNFINVLQNNRIFDSQGNQAVLESLKFNPYRQEADMIVRFPYIYTLNLQETFINPSGD